MKLCMFSPKGADLKRGWPGRVDGDRVVQLAAQTLQSFFAGGGKAREHAEYALDDVDLRPPVLYPPAVRDFYAFEQHVKTARGLRGLEMVPEWYEIPAFYFTNPAAIYGPEAEIPYPEGSNELDYELEAAVVIGKDVATSLGPFVVTPDELGDLRLEMLARVNGEERSRGNMGDMHHSWDAIVEHAARNTRLRAGDVLGSGTVGTGCILEHGDGRWLKPGDVVELEIEGIGVLQNRVGPKAP